jgi:hypothetical protein
MAQAYRTVTDYPLVGLAVALGFVAVVMQVVAVIKVAFY